MGFLFNQYHSLIRWLLRDTLRITSTCFATAINVTKTTRTSWPAFKANGNLNSRLLHRQRVSSTTTAWKARPRISMKTSVILVWTGLTKSFWTNWWILAMASVLLSTDLVLKLSIKPGNPFLHSQLDPVHSTFLFARRKTIELKGKITPLRRDCLRILLLFLK